MKFIYEGGTRTFRGYFFWNGKPVDVTDKATLAAIEKEYGFRRYEKVEETKSAAPVLVTPQKSQEPVANGCPKCGKPLKAQGAHFHIRACGK